MNKMRSLYVSPLLLMVPLYCSAAANSRCVSGEQVTAPDHIYQLRSDGTVIDLRTRLQWKRCSEGQTWDGVTCSGQPRLFTSLFNAYKEYRGYSFAGYSDWRFPNAKELFSLVESCAGGPALNVTAFPQTLFNIKFLSASVDTYSVTTSFYTVDFYFGTITESGSIGQLRLVRDAGELVPNM